MIISFPFLFSNFPVSLWVPVLQNVISLCDKLTSVRLLSMDAPEITELNLKELEKGGFLSKLNGGLRSYLQPKLNKNSVTART